MAIAMGNWVQNSEKAKGENDMSVGEGLGTTSAGCTRSGLDGGGEVRVCEWGGNEAVCGYTKTEQGWIQDREAKKDY